MGQNNEICDLCEHSLVDNIHGFDQNDYIMTDNGDCIHSGTCTYCKECNPILKSLLSNKTT